MSIRESFAQHFGEANAVRVEEASIGHQNDDKMNHGRDSWGKDPFKYHLLNCVSHQCFSKFAGHHGFDVPVDEVREWALEYADLHEYDGDIPDFIGMLAGAYAPWINWERAGIEMPEMWQNFDADVARWEAMSTEEHLAELHRLIEQGIELLNYHKEEKGPLND